mgnify:FL=1
MFFQYSTMCYCCTGTESNNKTAGDISMTIMSTDYYTNVVTQTGYSIMRYKITAVLSYLTGECYIDC